MSVKQMLYALTRVNVALAKPQPPSGAELQELRDLVAEALSAGAAMLQHMGRRRDPTSAGKPRGPAPSARYRIEVDSYAPRTIIGGQAAADAVNEHLTEFGMKQRVTMHTLIVGCARAGYWSKLCNHDGGTSSITVTRLPDAENSA